MKNYKSKPKVDETKLTIEEVVERFIQQTLIDMSCKYKIGVEFNPKTQYNQLEINLPSNTSIIFVLFKTNLSYDGIVDIYVNGAKIFNTSLEKNEDAIDLFNWLMFPINRQINQ